MAATSATMFFWTDWLGDQAVRRLTVAERGLWIDLIALAAMAAPFGHVCDGRGQPLAVSEIARVANCTVRQVEILLKSMHEKGVFSKDSGGRLYCRRMVRDASLKAKRQYAGSRGGKNTSLKYFKKMSSALGNGATAFAAANGTALDAAGAASRLDIPIHKEKNTTSYSEAAREEKPKKGAADDAGGERTQPKLQPSSELTAIMQRRARQGYGG
jgi:hypothetical protein